MSGGGRIDPPMDDLGRLASVILILIDCIFGLVLWNISMDDFHGGEENLTCA